jgi:hypothetical protein
LALQVAKVRVERVALDECSSAHSAWSAVARRSSALRAQLNELRAQTALMRYEAERERQEPARTAGWSPIIC